jgi:hypothetical protein
MREESPRTDRDRTRAENFRQLDPYFGKWQVKFAKLLEMSCFSPCRLLFRVDKLQQMTEKKYETVVDAYMWAVELCR